ncbi:type III secretion system translocon subunit SctE [Algicola sagamiensis]|uniref:type III secretion system translocon subunit SctE n=1 Tax=Algicola sagamiensis TaxID=163869 RepID=UPI0003721F46|nr:type III secretion system translocon subunit SctE [Algicola sagamiensis]
MAINKVPNVDMSPQAFLEGNLQSEAHRQSTEAQGVIKEYLDKDPDLVVSNGNDLKPQNANQSTYQPPIEKPIYGKIKSERLKEKLSDMEDLIRELFGVNQTLSDERLVHNSEQIRKKMDSREELNKEKLAKIDEAIKKQEEAKNQGIFAKVFGWIATVASVVVSTVIGAMLILAAPLAGPFAPFVAAAGALLIASAALQLVAAISAETGDWLNEAVADVLVFGSELLVGMGILDKPLSHEDAMKAAPWIVTATVIIMAIPSMFATGGASSLGLGVSAGGKAASAAAMFASRGGNLAKAGAQATGAVAQIGAGAANMVAATTGYKAEQLSILAEKIDAAMQKIMFVIGDLQKVIKDVLKDMEETGLKIAEHQRLSDDSKHFVTSNLK